jgi:hypothetical protein
MPEESEWERYFQPYEALIRLGLKKDKTFVDLVKELRLARANLVL